MLLGGVPLSSPSTTPVFKLSRHESEKQKNTKKLLDLEQNIYVLKKVAAPRPAGYFTVTFQNGNAAMILYQYRGPISDEKRFQYFVDLIRNGAMKFSKPSEFNDPFDCCPTQFSELPINVLPHGVTDELNRHIQHAISQIVGVACFTPHPNKMLMWSHYGDQHRGVCVGFDSDILINNVQKNSEGYPIYSEIRKVEYTKLRPNEEDNNAIFKKSEEWGIEDEYRIVSSAKKGHPEWGPGVWNVATCAIKEVVIGARVDPTIKDRIEKTIQSINPDIELKKVVLHTHTFELVIEKLSEQPNVAPMSGFLFGPNGNWIKT